MMRLPSAFFAGLLLGLPVYGCTGHIKTVRVEERLQPSAAEAAEAGEATVAPAPAVVKTTTIVEKHEQSRGLISTTFHFAGELLALPFRLIGGLLRVIF